jgi:hypothetical protein
MIKLPKRAKGQRIHTPRIHTTRDRYQDQETSKRARGIINNS